MCNWFHLDSNHPPTPTCERLCLTPGRSFLSISPQTLPRTANRWSSEIGHSSLTFIWRTTELSSNIDSRKQTRMGARRYACGEQGFSRPTRLRRAARDPFTLRRESKRMEYWYTTRHTHTHSSLQPLFVNHWVQRFWSMQSNQTVV